MSAARRWLPSAPGPRSARVRCLCAQAQAAHSCRPRRAAGHSDRPPVRRLCAACAPPVRRLCAPPWRGGAAAAGRAVCARQQRRAGPRALTLGHTLPRCASRLQERGDKKDSKKAKVERDETESEDDEVGEMVGEDEDEGTKGDYPYIKKVKLSNFMCHNNFTADFIKEINFIGGENGTGKSSILAAIAFGLGTKAEATGRAHNLKDFIGPHDDRAIVEVHMVQTSRDRFTQKLPHGTYTHTLPEEFIVERTVPYLSHIFSLSASHHTPPTPSPFFSPALSENDTPE